MTSDRSRAFSKAKMLRSRKLEPADCGISVAIASRRPAARQAFGRGEIMKGPNPKDDPKRIAVLIWLILAYGIGALTTGYIVYYYVEHGHYWKALVFGISFGLLFMVAGIFRNARLCVEIADLIVTLF